jgi:hypothetical protein
MRERAPSCVTPGSSGFCGNPAETGDKNKLFSNINNFYFVLSKVSEYYEKGD